MINIYMIPTFDNYIIRFKSVTFSRMMICILFPLLLYLHYSVAFSQLDNLYSLESTHHIIPKIGCCHYFGHGKNMELCCHKFVQQSFDSCIQKIVHLGGQRMWYNISCIGLEKLIKLRNYH